ncbi:MAG: VirD4-like conjugal transfer protein, CD1115 family [Oscillospiraceae bacterium]
MMNNTNLISIKKSHDNPSLMLPNGESVSLDTYKTRVNNNVLVFGGSGSGKTRSIVTPNLLAANGSYILSDPKGSLIRKWYNYFRAMGYRVVHLDFIHPERSFHYNPLCYINNSNDVQKLAHQIVYAGNGTSHGGSYDPFWDRSGELLLMALIGYVCENNEDPTKRRFAEIADLISEIDAGEWEDGRRCELDLKFERFSGVYKAKYGRESWAYKQYQKFRKTPPKTMGTIMLTVQATLSALETPEIRELMSSDNINIRSLANCRTIVFVEVSDTDRSKDFLANLFYSQAMNILCTYADDHCKDSRLPVPVRFILDDFGTNCRIEGFENMISNIRSREISAMIILQSKSQLLSSYGESAHTIIDNCDTMIYMGGNDVETARMIADRSNKPVHRILDMPIGTNWIFRRGEKPRFSDTVDITGYALDTVQRRTNNAKKESA